MGPLRGSVQREVDQPTSDSSTAGKKDSPGGMAYVGAAYVGMAQVGLVKPPIYH